MCVYLVSTVEIWPLGSPVVQLPDIDSHRPKPMLPAKLAAFQRSRDPTTALTNAIAYYEAQLTESPQDIQTLVLLSDTTLI